MVSSNSVEVMMVGLIVAAVAVDLVIVRRLVECECRGGLPTLLLDVAYDCSSSFVAAVHFYAGEVHHCNSGDFVIAYTTFWRAFFREHADCWLYVMAYVARWQRICTQWFWRVP